MIHHFRFIVPLLLPDEMGLTAIAYYDSAIQLARNSGVEPTEQEFEAGMDAAAEIKRACVSFFILVTDAPSQTLFLQVE